MGLLAFLAACWREGRSTRRATWGGCCWGLTRGEFALADAEEGPGGIGVEDLGVEVVDVELDGGGDVGSGDGDVVHFEHG